MIILLSRRINIRIRKFLAIYISFQHLAEYFDPLAKNVPPPQLRSPTLKNHPPQHSLARFFPSLRNNEAPNRICDSPGSRDTPHRPVSISFSSSTVIPPPPPPPLPLPRLVFHPRLPHPRKRLASESFYIFIKQLNSPPGEMEGEGGNGVKLKRNRTGWQFVLATWGVPGSVYPACRNFDEPSIIFSYSNARVSSIPVPRCFIHAFDLQIIDWLPINQRFLLT